ncbi:MAG: DUF1398 domain-containing protein [Planctomycetaceae bacterium]
MNSDQRQIVQECAAGSISGAMTFPQIVGRLAEIGIERYHADYSRKEISYYLADGDSLVVPIPWETHETGIAFSPSEVAAAVMQSQRGEHTYADFVRKTMSAGCVGYFIQITGRRAIDFGRIGDSHVEHFPSPTN